MSVQTSSANSADQDNLDSNRRLLRDELIGLMESSGCALPPAIDDHTSLITSGLLDSLALFNLIVWIETKTGRSIDPASVDVAHEWDSITKILQFIGSASGAPNRIELVRSRATDLSLPQSDYQIVKYNPDLKHAVAQFQTGLWSPDRELNLRYLEWKYEQNPYANKSLIYLAFHEKLLVGMRGFYASRWEAGIPVRQVPVLVADDLLISQNHRNRGLVTKIMQAAFDDLQSSDFQFVFNLSGSTLTVLNSLAMGWRSIGRLRPMGRRSFGVRFFRKLRLGVIHFPYVGRYAASHPLYESTERSPFVRFDRIATRPILEGGLTVEMDTQPRPAAMAALIRRLPHNGRLRHVRDQPYLEWRFRNPLREYRYLYAGGREEMDGYIVLMRSTDRTKPSQRVSIVDVEAVSDRIQTALLKAAITAGAFSELAIWTSTFDDRLVEQLRGLKFESIDSEQAAFGCPCFLVRPIDLELPGEDWSWEDVQLLDHRNWDIRMLYSMSG
jgi:acyl carrier protein